MTLLDIKELCKKSTLENTGDTYNLVGQFWRWCSYPITWIFMPTRMTPNMISFLSLIFAVVGFVILVLPLNNEFCWKVVGITGFSIWAILDCVDGNIARIKKQFSCNGDLWDAAAGYCAMSLMFLGMSAIVGKNEFLTLYESLILGGLTSIFSLYSRLLMHFKYGNNENEVGNKSGYSLLMRVVFNIVSPDALVIPFMYIANFFDIEWMFVIGYFILYSLECLYASYKLLR